MKMPGRKTQWADQNKSMRRFRKKQQLREEEKKWREEVLDVKSGCTMLDCECCWNEELD